MTKPWLASETTGPYAVVYRSGARPGGLLTGIELGELRRLLGLGVLAAGPIGSFPKVVDYDHLFAVPVRPTYVGAGVQLVVEPAAIGAETGDQPPAPAAPATSDDGQVLEGDSGVDQSAMDRL